MIQKLEILNETLNLLDEINNKRFSSENFKEVNSKIEKILAELKSNEEILRNKSSGDYNNIFNKLLNKIYMLETKIQPKANLLESFSNSKS